MRVDLPEKLRAGRVVSGPMASDPAWGAYGQFFVQGPCGERLCIVASGGDGGDPVSNGWEHVSVSTRRRAPNWQEMSFVKDLFWGPEECVVQYHPPRSEYVNNHPNCLHLWKYTKADFPMPPSILVGRKDLGILTKEQALAIWATESQ